MISVENMRRLPERLRMRFAASSGDAPLAIVAVVSSDGVLVPATEAVCLPSEWERNERRIIDGDRTYFVFERTPLHILQLDFLLYVAADAVRRYDVTFFQQYVGSARDRWSIVRKSNTQFKYPQQFSLVDATAVETRKALGELGHWTQVQLKDVGPEETLKWHTEEGIAEWMKVQEEIRAIGPALAPYAREHGEVAAAHQYVLQAILRSVRAYKTADTDAGKALIAELQGIKKQDILKRIVWLTQLAEQQEKKAA